MSAALAHSDAPLPAAESIGDVPHLATLHRLIAAGEALVADLLADDGLAIEKAAPFERLAGAVRRTIALARHIVANQPDPAKTLAAVATTKASVARRRVARSIDDDIARTTTTAGDANALRAELQERLDDPDLDLDIANRPVEAIIADIRRDLGLANSVYCTWPRRTAEAARALDQLARYTDAPNLAEEPDEPLPPSIATLIRRHTPSF